MRKIVQFNLSQEVLFDTLAALGHEFENGAMIVDAEQDGFNGWISLAITSPSMREIGELERPDLIEVVCTDECAEGDKEDH